MVAMPLETSEILSLGAEILRRGDLLCFRAKGRSMYPFIRDGDVLTVEPVNASELRLGEIAFYRTASRGVAHRFIGTSRTNGRISLILQGDRSIRPDPPVEADWILGRVTEISRNGRTVSLATPKRRLLAALWALSSHLRPVLYPILRGSLRLVGHSVEHSLVERILLLLARTEPGDRELDQLTRGLRTVDWEQLVQNSVLQGMAPRAYLHLRKLPNVVPRAVLSRFRRIYLLNLKHNLRLKSELKRVTSLLNSSGVKPIPLKGVFLAEWLYGDLGLRPSSDLDLLVRRDDLPVVRRELKRAGYESSGPYRRGFVEEFLRHEAFVRRSSLLEPLCIEIHWSFFPRLLADCDISRVWQNSVPVEMGSLEFLNLSPEDTLLYLSITLRLHGYIGLKLFCDVDQLLRAENGVDWNSVIQAAKENSQRVGLYYALRFTRDLLGTQVPESIMAELRPNVIQKAVVSLVLNERTVLRPVGSRLRRAYWDMVRLVTMDGFLTMPRTIAKVVLFHPKEVWARHQMLWQEQSPGRPFRTPSRH